MKRACIRSVLFNFAFYIGTAVCAFLCLPALLLPRKWFLWVVTIHTHLITFLEYTILGLKYEIRGVENLPEKPPYIVAAKHQSAYETFKLRVLFDDPAIILKKELLNIPLWGWFLKKSDVIPIDRSSPSKAVSSMEQGARHAMAQNRPIVLFPQGTRVMPAETAKDKPYKGGVYTIYKATDLPVIPMATNSGLFWPKKPFGGFLKSSGTVVFEFLAPVQETKDKKTFMNELEHKLETASQALMSESQDADKVKTSSKWLKILIPAVLLLAIAVYSVYWVDAAKRLKSEYILNMQRVGVETPATPEISGFPMVHLQVGQETVKTPDGAITIEDISAKGWPIPYLPVRLKTGRVVLKSYKWAAPLELDSIDATGRAVSTTLVEITDSQLKRYEFTAGVSGTVDLMQKPTPKLNLQISLENHDSFFDDLAAKNVLNKNTATFMSAGLGMFRNKDDGKIYVPLEQRGQALYLGPIPFLKLR